MLCGAASNTIDPEMDCEARVVRIERQPKQQVSWLEAFDALRCRRAIRFLYRAAL
jgi:hypothetical protein